jgi:hypothetical protein
MDDWLAGWMDDGRQTDKYKYNLYLSILLHYFTYNNTITVTMQLNKLMCMFSLLFSLHVSASVGHHQVLFPMPKLSDCIVPILCLVLSTNHTAVPLY